MVNHRSEPSQVLLADDDNDDYLIFSMAISEIPYKILLSRAENGEKLMEIIQQKTPDILFLDLDMPCKDGTTCLTEIRQDPKFNTLPVIVYSSFDNFRMIEKCFREGASLYVIKPNSLTELKKRLERITTMDWTKAMIFPPMESFVLR